jgi:hypothetical protein
MENNEFCGEHFEGLGNIWGAIVEDTSLLFGEPLRQSEVANRRKVTFGDKVIDVSLLRYSKDSSIAVGYLLILNDKTHRNELHSAFPIFEGLPNSLTILNTHTWGNGIEGVVAANTGYDGLRIDFYDPYYFEDSSKLIKGEKRELFISALALNLRQAEKNELSINYGHFYESELQEFLKENPDKTKADFPAVALSLKGMCMFLPTSIVGENQFRCPVLEVKKVSVLNINFYQLRVKIIGTYENKTFECYIYASELTLKGYIPQVGDDIEGVLWLCGYLSQKKRYFIKAKMLLLFRRLFFNKRKRQE